MTTAGNTRPIRVTVVDDDELVRTGLAAVLGAEPGLDVVGQGGDGADVPALVARTRPDVVVMDVRMPRIDGIDATTRLRDTPGAPAVIVITTFEHDSYVLDALRAGARGFVLKREPVAHLVTAIRVAATTDALLFPDTIRDLAAHMNSGDAEPRWIHRLTGRERAVLDLLVQGRTNAEIGRELFIGTETVKTHISAMLAKTGCRDRLALAVKALTGER